MSPSATGGARAERARVNALVSAVLAARSDPELVVLEGFHPLKHALRFGANVERVVAVRGGELAALIAGHAPELQAQIESRCVEIARADFRRLGPYEAHTGVLAVAKKKTCDPAALIAARSDAPLVLLDDPRHRGNLGAVVRVAAAAEARGVLCTGEQDPWHPVCVRGSAGLHFALPVAHAQEQAALAQIAAGGHSLIAFDGAGRRLRPEEIPAGAVLAFGSERRGLGVELLERAEAVLALPMRPGVSSLNLATAVAAVLYCRALGEQRR